MHVINVSHIGQAIENMVIEINGEFPNQQKLGMT
jgi:hypothetical protein